MNSTTTLSPVIPSQEFPEPHLSDPAGEPAAQRITLGVRLANLVAVTLPFAGLIVAIVLLWGHGFSWVHLGLMLGMYVATVFGITVGFHRLFTHRAFETNRTVKFILGALGGMAVQGPLLKWVSQHRRHHQHSDTDHDPHSPNMHGDGMIGLLKGMWHAHVGWLFKADAPDLQRLRRRPGQRPPGPQVQRSFSPVGPLLGLLIPAGLGGLLTLTWKGVLFGFIWGGLARIFLVHHVTWSINSVCHIWGSRPFKSHDESRNNLVFGVLAWAKGGITTTTPSPPPPATAWPGGRSMPATGSSGLCRGWAWRTT